MNYTSAAGLKDYMEDIISIIKSEIFVSVSPEHRNRVFKRW